MQPTELPQTFSSIPTARRANPWFTASLVLAGVLAGSHLGSFAGPSAASAQQKGEPTTPFNPGERQLQMVQQLTEMNQRLGRIEAKLGGTLNVKVTEMPKSAMTPPAAK